jgi:hypothetical protein
MAKDKQKGKTDDQATLQSSLTDKSNEEIQQTLSDKHTSEDSSS